MSSAFANVLQRVNDRTGYPPRGNGTKSARCPAHHDRSPSLSIGMGDDGRVLLHCQAGCDLQAILDALDMREVDLFETTPLRTSEQAQAEYEYFDELGELLYVVERRAGKRFRQRRPDGHGGWEWKLGDARRVLYRLPRVLAAVGDHQTIYVVEGEKDVHAAERAGVVATCNPGGAGKWRDEYAAALAGARVVVVADRDTPGRNHARAVAASLAGVACSVRVVEPAVDRDKADLSDHLAAGHSLDQLRPLDDGSAAAAPANDKPVPARTHLRDRLLSLSDLAALPPTRPLIDGLLYRDTLAQLAGPPGSYKSFAAIGMACAVAAGLPSWEGHRIPDGGGNVLYVATEGTAGLRARILAWCELTDVDPAHLTERLHILREPIQLGEPLDVTEAAEVAAERGVALVVLDTRARCTVGLEENSSTEQGIAIAAADRIREASRAAVLVVHHSGRSGDHGRGTNAWDGAVWSDLRMTGADLIARLHCEKHKDVPDGCDHHYRLVPHTVTETLMPKLPGQSSDEWQQSRSTLVFVQNGGWTPALADRRSTRDVLDIIGTTAGAEGLTRAQILELASETKLGRSTVYQAVKDLLDAGAIRNVGTPARARYVLVAGAETPGRNE